jgi:hypothetical protein
MVLSKGHTHDPHEGAQRKPDGAVAAERHDAAAVFKASKDRDVAPCGGIRPVAAVGKHRRHDLFKANAGRSGVVRHKCERAFAVAARHNAVGHTRDRLEGLNLQDVAGLGAFDEDRPGDNVRAVLGKVSRRPFIFGRNHFHVVENLGLCDAVAAEVLHRIATLIFQHAFV